MKQHFLFLQGCTSAFFHLLAAALRQQGYATARIDFNVGDWLFWHGDGVRWQYRQSMADFAPLLEAWIVRHGITDVVMLGDTRPMHRVACEVATKLGLVVHIFEEGYLRPNWLTYERDGINGHSRLPGDPDWYRRVAANLPAPVPVQARLGSLTRLALWELAYHLPNLLNPWLFPAYRTHRPVNSALEFAGWTRRFAAMPWYRWRDAQQISALLSSQSPYFVLPLQLDGDSQIVYHSKYASVSEMLGEVLASFARHSPEQARLVIKNHPLDTGLISYASLLKPLLAQYGLTHRVYYLESGSLERLFASAAGVVTVNSTAGMAALEAGVPVCCLGKAIYDIPGLTAQRGLHHFWQQQDSVEMALFEAFKKTVIYSTQIAGGFYHRQGCAMAIAQVLPAMIAPNSILERLRLAYA